MRCGRKYTEGVKRQEGRVAGGSRAGSWEPWIFMGYCLDEKNGHEKWGNFSMLHKTCSTPSELGDGSRWKLVTGRS